ncbi:MAG: hypothetical protein ACFFC7_03895 [Candidatus Hermodarchaeota archaeon]
MHSITEEFTEVLELISSSLTQQNLEISDFQKLYSTQLYLKKGDVDRAQRFLLQIIQTSLKIPKKKYLPVITYVFLARALIEARNLRFDAALSLSRQAQTLAQQSNQENLISTANQLFERLNVQKKTLELYEVIDKDKTDIAQFKENLISEVRTYLLNVKDLIEQEKQSSE